MKNKNLSDLLIMIFIIMFIMGTSMYFSKNQVKSEKEQIQPTEVVEQREYRIPIIDKGNYQPELSDGDIRELRKNNPEYIIKEKGRTVKSEQMIFEQRVKDYIDRNSDQIYEDLHDKYRD